jgi:hypothetical protein
LAPGCRTHPDIASVLPAASIKIALLILDFIPVPQTTPSISPVTLNLESNTRISRVIARLAVMDRRFLAGAQAGRVPRVL